MSATPCIGAASLPRATMRLPGECTLIRDDSIELSILRLVVRTVQLTPFGFRRFGLRSGAVWHSAPSGISRRLAFGAVVVGVVVAGAVVAGAVVVGVVVAGVVVAGAVVVGVVVVPRRYCPAPFRSPPFPP